MVGVGASAGRPAGWKRSWVFSGTFGLLSGKLFVDRYSPSAFTPIVSKSAKLLAASNLKPLNPCVGSAVFETASRKWFGTEVEPLTTVDFRSEPSIDDGSKKTRGSDRPSPVGNVTPALFQNWSELTDEIDPPPLFLAKMLNRPLMN
jgi:hypothetical protein